MIFFGIYDDLTSEHVPGLLKYDVCMTEQVSGPQGTKIAGRHMAMIPYYLSISIRNRILCHGEHIKRKPSLQGPVHIFIYFLFYHLQD